MGDNKVSEFGQDVYLASSKVISYNTCGFRKPDVDRSHDAEKRLAGVQSALFLGLQSGANGQRTKECRVSNQAPLPSSLSRRKYQQLKSAEDRPSGHGHTRDLLV